MQSLAFGRFAYGGGGMLLSRAVVEKAMPTFSAVDKCTAEAYGGDTAVGNCIKRSGAAVLLEHEGFHQSDTDQLARRHSTPEEEFSPGYGWLEGCMSQRPPLFMHRAGTHGPSVAQLLQSYEDHGPNSFMSKNCWERRGAGDSCERACLVAGISLRVYNCDEATSMSALNQIGSPLITNPTGSCGNLHYAVVNKELLERQRCSAEYKRQSNGQFQYEISPKHGKMNDVGMTQAREAALPAMPEGDSLCGPEGSILEATKELKGEVLLEKDGVAVATKISRGTHFDSRAWWYVSKSTISRKLETEPIK